MKEKIRCKIHKKKYEILVKIKLIKKIIYQSNMALLCKLKINKQPKIHTNNFIYTYLLY